MKLSVANVSGGHMYRVPLSPDGDVLAKVKGNRLVRTVTNPFPEDEPNAVYNHLCTSPIHYRNILIDELFTNYSSPSYRFSFNNLRLSEVVSQLGEG